MEYFKNYTREQLIAWLCNNDRNGIYSDADCEIEGIDPLTKEEAYELVIEQIKG
jgi:hypothetical protein